jgi:hypothetical protein
MKIIDAQQDLTAARNGAVGRIRDLMDGALDAIEAARYRREQITETRMFDGGAVVTIYTATYPDSMTLTFSVPDDVTPESLARIAVLVRLFASEMTAKYEAMRLERLAILGAKAKAFDAIEPKE